MYKGFIFVGILLLSMSVYAGRIEYGRIYVKNFTPWDALITGKVKDRWDNVSNQRWDIPKDKGVELLGSRYAIKDLHLTAQVRDESKIEPWLRKTYPIRLEPAPIYQDLIIKIGVDKFSQGWRVDQKFVSSVKTEYGGPTGYHIEIE